MGSQAVHQFSDIWAFQGFALALAEASLAKIALSNLRRPGIHFRQVNGCLILVTLFATHHGVAPPLPDCISDPARIRVQHGKQSLIAGFAACNH